MNFKQQQILQDNWQTLINISQKHEAEKAFLPYKLQIDNFVMRVPLVGVFSAGKSSLLNKLLGDSLLSTDIDPRTCIATELHYADNERFVGHLTNGTIIPLSRDDVHSETFVSHINASQDKKGHMSVYLNAPILNRFPHICLVDLPGLDSNFESHNQMIDDYINRSLAYCIVVSIEDGELKASTQQFLQTLKISQMPVILVITKSDRKPVEDVDKVSQKITESITEILGKAPIASVTVSARRAVNLDKLINAFAMIENQAEQRFTEVVARPMINQLSFLIQNLDKKINTDNTTAEKLQAEKENLNKEMAYFHQNLNSETQALENESHNIVIGISELVKSRLIGQLDVFTNQIINGGTINDSIENTVRQALMEGIETQLKPAINRYVKDVIHEMPSSLGVVNPTIDNIDTNNQGFQISTGLTATSSALTALAINPVIGLVLAAGMTFLKEYMSNQEKRFQEERKQELTKQKINYEVIPQVQTTVIHHLKQTIQKSIAQAKAQLSEQAEQRNIQFNAQLNQIEQNLKRSQEEQARLKESYLADRVVLDNLLTKLKQGASE